MHPSKRVKGAKGQAQKRPKQGRYDLRLVFCRKENSRRRDLTVMRSRDVMVFFGFLPTFFIPALLIFSDNGIQLLEITARAAVNGKQWQLYAVPHQWPHRSEAQAQAGAQLRLQSSDVDRAHESRPVASRRVPGGGLGHVREGRIAAVSRAGLWGRPPGSRQSGPSAVERYTGGRPRQGRGGAGPRPGSPTWRCRPISAVQRGSARPSGFFFRSVPKPCACAFCTTWLCIWAVLGLDMVHNTSVRYIKWSFPFLLSKMEFSFFLKKT